MSHRNASGEKGANVERKADQIRRYVLTHYIEPARRRGEKRITIRSGDVHKAMNLKNSLPAVASALGAKMFETYARVRLVQREGPHMGANLFLTFDILH